MVCCRLVYCRCNAGSRVHARPIAGQRLRHALVGLAHDGALRIELWIILVGARERRLDALGFGRLRRSGKKPHRERSADQDDHPKWAPAPLLREVPSPWSPLLTRHNSPRTAQSGTLAAAVGAYKVGAVSARLPCARRATSRNSRSPNMIVASISGRKKSRTRNVRIAASNSSRLNCGRPRRSAASTTPRLPGVWLIVPEKRGDDEDHQQARKADARASPAA